MATKETLSLRNRAVFYLSCPLFGLFPQTRFFRPLTTQQHCDASPVSPWVTTPAYTGDRNSLLSSSAPSAQHSQSPSCAGSSDGPPPVKPSRNTAPNTKSRTKSSPFPRKPPPRRLSLTPSPYQRSTSSPHRRRPQPGLLSCTSTAAGSSTPSVDERTSPSS